MLQVSSYGVGHPGGLELCAEKLAIYLRKCSCRVIWAFGSTKIKSGPSRYLRYPVIDPVEPAAGVPVPVPTSAAFVKLFRAVQRCDVVLIHDFMYLSSALTTFYCVLLRRPFVLMVHVWRVHYGNYFLNLLQTIAHVTLGRFAVSKAFAVVTYNRRHAQNIKKHHARTAVFIPNGVDGGSELNPNRSSLEQFRSDGRYSRRVCFAGRRVAKKGLNIVREAAIALPNVEFMIAGTGPIDPEEWRLPNVTTLGWIDRTTLHDVFDTSDLFLLPSRGEGFPLVVQEAMAAGLRCAIFRETWEAWGRDEQLFHILSDDGYIGELAITLEVSPTSEERASICAYARSSWNWEHTARAYARVLDGAYGCGVSQVSGVSYTHAAQQPKLNKTKPYRSYTIRAD